MGKLRHDAEILNEDGDSFDNKKVKAQLKLILKEYKKRKYTDLPDFPEGSLEAHVVALTKNADTPPAYGTRCLP